MNETPTPTPPAPAAGSELMCTVTLTLSEHVLLVRTIRERAYSLRQFAASTRNESLATQALDEAERRESRAYELVNTNWTKVKRLLAVAEQAMQSIRDYPCGHKPSGVGGHCNACEALRQWDDLANTERRRPMNETPTPTPPAPAAGSGTVKFAYRVHPVLLKTGTMITTGAMIQAREVGKRTWMPVNIGGVPLLYRSLQTAERHCGWLKNPVGTEPEWGQDASPNTQSAPGPLK